jgi:MtrB/PioB family decaheme-associated outer membrane protein
MMKRISYKHTALATLLSFMAGIGAAQADMDILGGKAVINSEVNAGVQQKIVDGSDGKFEEYRDVQNGVLLNDLRLKVDGKETPYYLDVKIKNPVQDNEFYEVKGGIHGKFGLGLFYDSTPHNFGSGKFLLNDAGGGRFVIGDVVQQQLQNNEILRSQRLTYDPATGLPLGTTSTAGGAFINPADPQNMALDSGMTGIVSNLYGSANGINFGLKREKTGFSIDFRPFDDVKVWSKVTNEKRTGARRINSGTYERYNNGNTTTVAGVGDRGHLVDFFLVAGIELPEVIDYRTTTLNVGTGVYKKRWLADLEYTFTNFDNKVGSIVWDNPFRLDSASATTAAGGSGNPFNRGRSALGQITLSPDSQSHDFTVSGSVELPLHGRFTGTVGYGWITQDEAFDPYTLNSAIIAGNVAGTPAAAGLALPQNSLNGDVATITQSYQLSIKPVEPLAVTARYRYYDYNNSSDNITFPGYSAFGDSFWRTEKNDVSAGQDALVRNEALSYTRQNADLSLDYHVMKPLTIMAEGFWEGWDRDQLRIDGTTELGIGGGFIYKPVRYAKLKGSYRYAHRTVDGYKVGNTAENPEAVGLANYDWADRVRHKADLRLHVTPLEAVTVTLSGQYQDDKFGGDNRFGLKKNDSVTGALDVTYAMSERLSLYANYVKEYRKGSMRSGAKDDAFDDPTTPENETTIGPFNPENYWNSDIYEKVDTVGLGATVQLIPDKLTLNTGYTLSYSKMDFNTVNPNGAVKLANAAAQSFPTVRNRYQEIKADIGYNFTKNIKAGLTYLYEWYKLDDFASTPAYTAGASFENSTKYLYTGANNFSYDAHVAGAYLSCKF